MTSPNSSGVSEVFYTVTAPQGVAPASLIERWDILAESSPVKVVAVQGKADLGIGSVWDNSSETFSYDPETVALIATHRESYAFLVDDEVVSVVHINTAAPGDTSNERFAFGFAEPVIIQSVPEDSPVDLGYTWDGTSFTAPTGA